jgi:SRSO17 transposase
LDASDFEVTATMSKPIEDCPTITSIKVNTEPITGTLESLRPIVLESVSHSHIEPLWDQLVSRYHYLGYRNLLGHRLKYLVFIQDRPVAALSWSAPALKLRVRDRYIGWSDEQRKTHLDRIASNSRFLILPWVDIPNLASHVLSLNIEGLSKDWEQRFHRALWLLETFVDPRYFKGTSYKAANWKFIGHSYGSGKQGKGYFYHGVTKEVYLYVLEPNFRKIIGCEQKPYDLFHRPPQPLNKVEDLKMILRHAGWTPDLIPCMELTEQDVEAIADELVAFHKQFHDCFGRIEHQRLGLAYFSGLMSNLNAKSAEPIALEFLDKPAVRAVQRFMKSYQWDHDAINRRHQSRLSELTSCPDGMINVDSSEFVKKGKESVGVARQYCGALGKVENCQSGVFVGYSSEKGYGLLSSQLYMPKEWFSKEYEKRREDNLLPKDLTFQTKPQIALNLINEIVQSNLFQASWIGCDATFGSDPHFLKSLPKGLYYFANVRSNTQVFLKKPKVALPPYKGRGRPPKKMKPLSGQPKAQSVSEIAQSLNCPWQRVVLAEGAKGPIVADIVRLRVFPSHKGLPQKSSLWLFIRRTPDGQIKYAFSNAPKDIPLSEMCKACTMRWGIEQCFEEGKDQLGMDHYEHRSWPAWHRHMIYVFLALHFLLRLRIRFKKNANAHTTTSSQARSSSTASPFTQCQGRY